MLQEGKIKINPNQLHLYFTPNQTIYISHQTKPLIFHTKPNHLYFTPNQTIYILHQTKPLIFHTKPNHLYLTPNPTIYILHQTKPFTFTPNQTNFIHQTKSDLILSINILFFEQIKYFYSSIKHF